MRYKIYVKTLQGNLLTFSTDEYVAHSTSRVLIRLINIFFALAIFAAAIYAVYAMGLVDLFKGNK